MKHGTDKDYCRNYCKQRPDVVYTNQGRDAGHADAVLHQWCHGTVGGYTSCKRLEDQEGVKFLRAVRNLLRYGYVAVPYRTPHTRARRGYDVRKVNQYHYGLGVRSEHPA